MNRLSNRINEIEGSGIRKVFDLAAKCKGEVINLSIGQPDFKVSKKLKEAIKRSIDEDKNSYTSTAGLLELKQAIAKKLNRENKIKAKDEDIIITSGVSGAIFLLFASILNPGDEVILPDPYFVVYEQIIRFFGATPVLLDTYPYFQIEPEKMGQLIGPKTKAIIINSPNNPTGAVYDRETLEAVAEIARTNNLLVVSDEIYEYFDYDNKFFSIGSVYENTVTLNGYSKSHAITGWRVGYAHGPKEIIEAMNKLQQYTFVCAPSIAQHALAQEPDFEFAEAVAEYKKKRDFIYSSLSGLYELNIPEGAFYAFIKIPPGRNNFIEDLAENKLLAVPGGVFSKNDSYFRICFAVDDDTLKKGVEVLQKLVK